MEHVVTTIGAYSGQVNQVGGGLIGNDKSIAVGHISREFERLMRQCRICGIALIRGPFMYLGYVEPLMRLAPDP